MPFTCRDRRACQAVLARTCVPLVLPSLGLAISLATGACSRADLVSVSQSENALYVDTDSMGVAPISVRAIAVHARADLVENSAALMSRAQPGIIFTINDSGNEPLLFALDTTGADRGAWRVVGASNVDWEAAALGPCPSVDASARTTHSSGCIYIGDTGDNNAVYTQRAIYRVREPGAQATGFSGALATERLDYRYPDRPHDVEAMYVAADGTVTLITKRPLEDARGHLRPALVFSLPNAFWGSDTTAVAQLVDSLPIVPGSAPRRLITDASLSTDGRLLAVRTYAQIYVFATDSSNARVRSTVRPAICNIAQIETVGGEGITWYADSSRLLLTSEGWNTPMHVVNCPLPSSSREAVVRGTA